MSLSSSHESACRLGMVGAALSLAGVALSGPIALLLVHVTHPQPRWRDVASFVDSYHPVQSLPYLGGLLLVAGLVLLITSAHALAPIALAARTGTAQLVAAVFAALISLNYIVQTTFLPGLLREGSAGDAPIVAALTMANPVSLAWAVEMWGYAFFGVACWLVAPVFQGSRVERATAVLFQINAAVSVVGALATVASPGWGMSTAGLAAFALWNALIAAMAVMVLLTLRRRTQAAALRAAWSIGNLHGSVDVSVR